MTFSKGKGKGQRSDFGRLSLPRLPLRMKLSLNSATPHYSLAGFPVALGKSSAQGTGVFILELRLLAGAPSVWSISS